MSKTSQRKNTKAFQQAKLKKRKELEELKEKPVLNEEDLMKLITPRKLEEILTRITKPFSFDLEKIIRK